MLAGMIGYCLSVTYVRGRWYTRFRPVGTHFRVVRFLDGRCGGRREGCPALAENFEKWPLRNPGKRNSSIFYAWCLASGIKNAWHCNDNIVYLCHRSLKGSGCRPIQAFDFAHQEKTKLNCCLCRQNNKFFCECLHTDRILTASQQFQNWTNISSYKRQTFEVHGLERQQKLFLFPAFFWQP